MTLLRSGVAVIAGALLILFMHGTLEQTLVRAIADGPITSEAAFVAVRNRPVVLVLTIVTLVIASTLAGYIVAKIAGAHEVRHALGSAVIMTGAYALAFIGENAMLPPLWVRVAMLIVTPPALVAGASIRAQARSIQLEAAAARPEERS
jgi:hypothetical protein